MDCVINNNHFFGTQIEKTIIEDCVKNGGGGGDPQEEDGTTQLMSSGQITFSHTHYILSLIIDLRQY
jgi:hypothetical protein